MQVVAVEAAKMPVELAALGEEEAALRAVHIGGHSGPIPGKLKQALRIPAAVVAVLLTVAQEVPVLAEVAL